jgi:hypothetical protein
MAPSTYSFKDVVGSFFHPLAGTQIFAGQIGMGQFVVKNTTERSTHDLASDGTIMVSYISGAAGSFEVECQQNSIIHHFLLDWFNIITTLAEQGDVANWASAAIAVRSQLDGASHLLSGVSPGKIPDKTYTAQGGKVTWNLMACEVVSL